MKTLPEVPASLLTVKYYPDGHAVTENPPRFTWVPPFPDDVPFILQVSRSRDFTDDCTLIYRNIPYNFFTSDDILPPGTYYWRYSVDTEKKDCCVSADDDYNFSAVRSFIVADDLIQTPLAPRAQRYDFVSLEHPRLWLGSAEAAQFADQLSADDSFCGFNIFYEKSVSVYEMQDFPAEPEPYPGNKRVVALWRKNYITCQKALEYIRSLSAAGVLLRRTDLIEKAKKALLDAAQWDLRGPTSRDYNDECSFRIAYALAFGYDWLHNHLTADERSVVRTSLFARTKQVADHIIINSRIHFSLYDSHAVRSLSSVITPCCIALLGDREDESMAEQAQQWLDYAIEYFNVLYTPWGGSDGGWAEGPSYWTTGMAFVIDALDLIKNYTGINIFKRPFFQKTGDFPLYCNPPDTYCASFGDQSNLGKKPGHKTACNIRRFAAETGNELYQKYYDAVFERDPVIDNDFFNNGWWDFAFDDMVYAYMTYKAANNAGIGTRSAAAGNQCSAAAGCGAQAAAHTAPCTDLSCAPSAESAHTALTAKPAPSRVKWFRDIGWAALNVNMFDPDSHLFFITKSSQYGSVSHSHGDQTSFMLFAYGEPLVIESGYYIGFNTSMHRDWRRQTKAHNTVLFNGQGQYAGMDKVKQLSAHGEICEVREEKQYVYIKERAAQAYRENVSDLIDFTREIWFVDDAYFVIVDTASSQTPYSLDWNLHSLSPYSIDGHRFSVNRPKASLDGSIIYSAAPLQSLTQTDRFTGADYSELEGLENQHHLTMSTRPSRTHCVVTLLVPSPSDHKKNVSAIKDDQGHDVFFYFSHEGKTFSLCVNGSIRYQEQ